MPKYKIPEKFITGFKSFLELTESQRKNLYEIIKELDVESLPFKIGEKISTSLNLEVKVSIEIAEALYSLNSLFEAADEKNKKMISDSLCDSLKDEFSGYNELIENTDWDKISDFFTSIISDTPLSFSYKTLVLSGEHENIFKLSRIITDIRPVFYNDNAQSAKQAIIFHKLKIEFEDANNNRNSLYFALDSDDLKQLKKVIERAESKENILKDSFSPLIKFIDFNKFIR